MSHERRSGKVCSAALCYCSIRLSGGTLNAHVLKAVALVDGGGGAIIDDEYVPVGREIDGFLLVSVDEHSAVLRLNSVLVTLKMDSDEKK